MRYLDSVVLRHLNGISPRALEMEMHNAFRVPPAEARQDGHHA